MLYIGIYATQCDIVDSIISMLYIGISVIYRHICYL